MVIVQDEGGLPPSPLPASPSFCLFRFFPPTDEELLLHYLANKIHGRPLPSDHIIDGVDVYSADPWDLMPAPSSSSAPMDAYFFTQRQRLSRSKVKRTAGSGTWKINGTERVHSGGVVIGHKATFSFQVNDGPRQSSGWIMHEFELKGRSDCDGDINLDLVICRVKLNPQMEKKRKRECGMGQPNRKMFQAASPANVPPLARPASAIAAPQDHVEKQSGEFLVAASPVVSYCIDQEVDGDDLVDITSSNTTSNMVVDSSSDSEVPPLFHPPSDQTTALQEQEVGQQQDHLLGDFLAASPEWITSNIPESLLSACMPEADKQ